MGGGIILNLCECFGTSQAQASPQHKQETVQVESSTVDTGGVELHVSAPAIVSVGDLVEVNADKSLASSFSWKVSGVKDGNYRVVDQGRRLLLAADSAGTITINVAGALEGSVALHSLTIQVGKSSPPVNKHATLADKVQLAINDCGLIQHGDQRNALADAFRSVAVMIDSKALTDTSAIIKATKSMTKEALLPDEEKWQPVVALLEGFVADTAKAGKLKTMEDHANLWREIAKSI